MSSHTHGRTPGSGSAGGVDLHVAKPLKPIGEFSEGSPGNEAEREELAAAVGVSGKLQAYTGMFCDRQAGLDVVQENAGGAVFKPQAFKISAQGQG